MSVPPKNNSILAPIKQSWNDISPVGKLALAAIIGFLIYYTTDLYFVAPMKVATQKMSNEVNKQYVPEDPEPIVQMKNAELNQIRTRIHQVQQEIQQLQARSNSLSLSQSQNIVAQLRKMMTKDGITLLTETEIPKSQIQTLEVSSRTTQTAPSRGRVVYDIYGAPEPVGKYIGLTLPPNMDQAGYDIKISGSFQEVQKFLNDVYCMKSIFAFKNIKFSRSPRIIRRKDLSYSRTVEVSFQLYIPYFKESGK